MAQLSDRCCATAIVVTFAAVFLFGVAMNSSDGTVDPPRVDAGQPQPYQKRRYESPRTPLTPAPALKPGDSKPPIVRTNRPKPSLPIMVKQPSSPSSSSRRQFDVSRVWTDLRPEADAKLLSVSSINWTVPNALGESHLEGEPIQVSVAADGLSSLEFRTDAPLVSYYQRRFVRQNQKQVRVACLYSGFLRDFQQMLGTCTDILRNRKKFLCKKKRRRKLFGKQRRNILEGTDCDIFISTWDLRGTGGRFNKYIYPSERVAPIRILREYREQLAALHMQNYTLYNPVWRYMHRFPRKFYQTRPTESIKNEHDIIHAWKGVPEEKEFIRLNDYSQSYKQWAVLQLVARYERDMGVGQLYDVYFRLRTDLRAVKGFRNFHWLNRTTSSSKNDGGSTFSADATNNAGYIAFDVDPAGNMEDPFGHGEVPIDEKAAGKNFSSGATKMEQHHQDEDHHSHGGGGEDDNSNPESNAPSQHQAKSKRVEEQDDESIGKEITHHVVGPRRVFTNNFEVSDFAYIGVPEVISRMGSVWAQCLGRPLRGERPTVDRVKHDWIAEYNLMVWRVIFDAKWEIDSGGRCLTPNRGRTKKPKPMKS